MRYLLDTMILSELMKAHRAPAVEAFVSATALSDCALSVLSIGEITRGVARLPAGAKKSALEAWVNARLGAVFSGRILTVNEAIAARWGRLDAQAGRTLPAIDGLIAATALVHGLTLVTRNVRDFRDAGAAALNPWDSAP